MAWLRELNDWREELGKLKGKEVIRGLRRMLRNKVRCGNGTVKVGSVR